ncbi:MFS transporter [Altererythrobacter sp. GH1-8]|uniref:MFS transporter n=1 Tax=Altererythrobacter sp. GH1-8 TaxID=3349333 RepID=UPI00374D563D
MAIAFAAWLLTNVDQSLFGYVIPQIQTEFGLGLEGIGYIISLSFVAGMILPVGIGVLTDRFGARLTLPLCLFVSAVLVGMQGLLTGLYAFALARILSFAFSAALSPITNSIVVTAAPVKWRAIWVAVLQCAYPLGWLVSAMVVAPLIEHISWRSLFFVGFIIAPIALILGYLLPKDMFGVAAAPSRRVESTTARPFAALFAPEFRKRTALLSLAFFSYSGAVASTAFYLPTFLHEVRGYSLPDAAIIVGSGYGISVIGYLGSALVSTYLLPLRTTIVLWNVLAALLVTIMIWLPTSFWQDFLAFAVMGIFYFGTAAILITYVLESFPDDMRTTAAAVCGTACVSTAMALFPTIVAILVPSLGWQVTFTAIITPCLVISALAILSLKGTDQLFRDS